MCRWNLVTVLQDLVLAVVINTSATMLAGAPFAPATWYMGTCTAFATNVLLQLVLPVPLAGRAATGWLGASRVRPFLSIFVENLIFVTFISLTMAAVQTQGVGLISTWLSTYPQLMLIGYATSLVLFAFFSHVSLDGGNPKD